MGAGLAGDECGFNRVVVVVVGRLAEAGRPVGGRPAGASPWTGWAGGPRVSRAAGVADPIAFLSVSLTVGSLSL